MSSLVNGIFGNDSIFGRVMNVCYIVIVSNLLFILFSLPVVTAGASFTAMYHVIMKMLHSNEMIFPVKEFWIGFKSNFKQSTLLWILMLAVSLLVYGDMKIIEMAGGAMDMLKIFMYAMILAAVVIAVYIFPVTAFFKNSVFGQIRTALYFAMKNPIRTLLMAITYAFIAFAVYVDPERQPIYAFIFFFAGFGVLALISAKFMIRDFEKSLETSAVTA